MNTNLDKPLLIFDGDCGFCRFWIERWRLATQDRVDYASSKDVGNRFSSLKPEDFAETVVFVEPDGRTSRGAQAVFRSLSCADNWGRLWLTLYERMPPFRGASEFAYRFVARRRSLFSRLTRLLWGTSPAPPRIDGTSRAVLAGLGLCYLVAFWSLSFQVRGLIGSNGLAPAGFYLDAVARQLGNSRYWRLPTFAWIACSDKALIGFCAAGAFASLGLIFDIATGLCAFACWALYLSLCAIGTDFLSFQWDALILEAGLIGIFLAPWALKKARRTKPSHGALWLMRLLLFKLVLESGAVKLLSSDLSWRSLSALRFHYWTQPLPTPLAWWANRMPPSFQTLSCLLMFAVELGAPWFLLGPRRLRALGAGMIVTLMVLIGLTGNYGFFNLLTCVLCLAALDDSFAPLARLAPNPVPRAMSTWRSRTLAVFAALWLAASGAAWSFSTGSRPALMRAWALLDAIAPLRSINSYGLFAVMTTNRDEISVEVSADGSEWREWPFRWKPGDPRRAPPFIAPHMPRLDWQMWFAALGAPSPWVENLLYHLLKGSADVEELLGPSPLGSVRPVYARATLWATRFATPEEHRADGSWWHRELKGLYFPVVSLKTDAR